MVHWLNWPGYMMMFLKVGGGPPLGGRRVVSGDARKKRLGLLLFIAQHK